MVMEQRKICAQAVNKWGYIKQLGVAIEEASELIKAISKVLRNDIDPSDTTSRELIDLAEEVADVEIMLAQIRMMIGDEIIDSQKQWKLSRLEALIKS